ncbi:heavy metal transport/detoxification superfamily protein [Actinidia rufa]|uniref:Heavy metal transport/detoxification superfamily protein n=1 Tax=Actinidia rufa TaxID=165716 RepID=A0A7J0DYS2_9ERIC|nr:heavy metal transport/detoxification superfamily protein [Actinidia rufa]
MRVHMDCAGCESKIRKALQKLKGVDDVDINMGMQKVTVTGWADQKKDHHGGGPATHHFAPQPSSSYNYYKHGYDYGHGQGQGWGRPNPPQPAPLPSIEDTRNKLLKRNVENPDNREAALPDQAFGLYFGWAKIDAHEIFKVMSSIGWECSCCSCKRKIEKRANYIEIAEEDKSIVRAALDLPVFGLHTSLMFFSEASFEDDSCASEKNE